MSAISQLLLTGFRPKFKGRLMGSITTILLLGIGMEDVDTCFVLTKPELGIISMQEPRSWAASIALQDRVRFLSSVK